jgi:hypothetical protein
MIPNIFVYISKESKERLINQFGPEIILRCSCGDTPGHSMWSKSKFKCPTCSSICEVIDYEWALIKNS